MTDNTDEIDRRIENADEIRSGHELYKDDVSLTVTFDDLNEPQAIALLSMLDAWEMHARFGSSRWMSFFVDGDGPFNPVMSVDVDDDVIQSDDLKDTAEVGNNKFDADPVTGWFIDRALEVDEQEESGQL